MILLFVSCFFLMLVGIVLLLGITPEMLTEKVTKILTPKMSLREQAMKMRGRKKTHRLVRELTRIQAALETTGRGNQFAVACTVSLVLLFVGCFLALVLDNVFLLPVLAVSLALIPFAFIKRTTDYYENHIREELETALSIITTSYMRSDDFVAAIKENVQYLRPPMKEIFSAFVTENIMITSDIRASLRNLKERIDNAVFREWCDIAIACQDDRTLKSTLMPTVAKLTEIRLANAEIKGVLLAARTEYFTMACLVVANIPILYILNQDWYSALMYTVPGKIVLGICGIAILITCILMLRYTKPIEYKE